MAARSVTELLPRPFGELTLDDVAGIIETIGEERETLYFERKARVSGAALAKACSAFANTYGGLLVVGVGDEDDQLVGIEPLAAEAQLWVKDTLRSLVLPMPPFRARWLPTEGGNGLLLVLVEESSATPHLLTRSGAIYVRNPGSSDPAPIIDQRRLLDLAARGERARDDAVANARHVLKIRLSDVVPTESLALAPTGIPVNFEELVFAPGIPDFLSRAAWGERKNPAADGRVARWDQHHVGVWRLFHRTVMQGTPIPSSRLHGGIAVHRSGATVVYRGYEQIEGGDDPERGEGTELATLRQRFVDDLAAVREILAEFGAHGDLSLAYRLDLSGRRYIQVDRKVTQIREPRTIETWTTFEDMSVADRVFAEVRRIGGLEPVGLGD